MKIPSQSGDSVDKIQKRRQRKHKGKHPHTIIQVHKRKHRNRRGHTSDDNMDNIYPQLTIVGISSTNFFHSYTAILPLWVLMEPPPAIAESGSTAFNHDSAADRQHKILFISELL